MTEDDLRVQLARTDERATKALELIARHEAACDRRYEEMTTAIEKLRGRWVPLGGFIILSLLSIIGYLLINGRPWA